MLYFPIDSGGGIDYNYTRGNLRKFPVYVLNLADDSHRRFIKWMY